MKKIKKDKNKKLVVITGFFIAIITIFIIFYFQRNYSLIPNKSTNKPTEVADKPFVLNKESLVGIWQDAPSMAAGWSDHYNFYPSGKYTLYFNEMYCIKRIYSESGFWQFNDSTSEITLKIKQRIKVQGGTLVQTSGSSCEWEGGETVVETINRNEVKVYKLSVPTGPVKYYEDTISPDDVPWYKMVVFNDKPFWRFNDPPTGSWGDNFPEPTGF